MKEPVYFKFRLYVAGNGPHSTQAVANLGAICREYLPDRHEIEIVDVIRHPKRGLEDGVMMTPLLMKIAPGPVRKIAGSLSQREPVLQALGLPD